MSQTNFGAGLLVGIPNVANPTHRLFAALQDVSADTSFDLKMLYGQSQFALEQFRGKGKIDLKATAGRIDPLLFNDIFFGASAALGEVLNTGTGEAGVIPGTTFTITVANGSTFATDLGVLNLTTGRFMVRVASSPITGQYSVNTTTGAYLFATADTGVSVKIYYTYGSTTTGQTVTVTNPPMGSGPIFKLIMANKTQNVGGQKSLSFTFNAVQASKLSMPLKLDDTTLPQFDMSAQDDGSGNICSFTATG
jgi:hypothetical protein